MNAIRSILFNFLFYIGSLALSLLLIWSLLLPRRWLVKFISTLYGRFVHLTTRSVMGLRLEVRGAEHIPSSGAFILAAKHQSAYETLVLPFMKELRYPVIVLKKELTYLPIWGWYPLRMGQIAIDRGNAAQAIQSIVRGCKKAKERNRPMIIFPQGTRVAVKDKKPYKPGLAKIYRDLDLPILPMALNTGVFWGRNSFFKKPGTIVFEFLPVIPPGQPPLKMMKQLEETIEAASDRLAQQS